MAGARVGVGECVQTDLAGGGMTSGVAKLEEPDHSSSNWYFSREEIEKRSPSRLDGIDLKKETYFRKSYCTFLQDLGMCLKVPQVTIATAIVFSHRFFLRQSHLKNDRFIIATICMFLAGKVEETPRPLRDVILMSYEIRHKKDPVAVARIKQKDIYEEQKELVLAGERLVLTTLGFDLNIHHPYKPLVAAIKKLKVAQNALAQVAWNFVNDGLRTSLCLQFKPHHIAAGAIFLAAKFLKVKLPSSDGEKVWWQDFEVTPRQLEEVSNQMLELYEQNKTLGTVVPNGSRASDPGSSVVTVNRVKGLDTLPSVNGHPWNHTSSNTTVMNKTDKHSQMVKADDAVTSSRRDEMYEVSAIHAPSAYGKQETDHSETHYVPAHENGSVSVLPEVSSVESTRTIKPVSNGHVKFIAKEEFTEHLTNFEDGQMREELRVKKLSTDVRIKSEQGMISRKARVKTEVEDRTSIIVDGTLTREVTEAKSSLEERETGDVVDSIPGIESSMASVKVKIENVLEEPKKQRTNTNFVEDVNTDKVKTLAQKRRKYKGGGLDLKPAGVKVELTDEDELLERELESGVDAAAEALRVKQEVRDVRSKPVQKAEHDRVVVKKEGMEDGESGWKRRGNEENCFNEKRWTKSTERGDRTDWVDVEAARSRLGDEPSERGEDGELPSSSHTHDHTWSPRQSEKRPVVSGSHDKNGSPSSSKRHRDLHGRRDGHRDSRMCTGLRERDYHPRDHHHQYSTDGDRDAHHHKDKDYLERDHKKIRAHELHCK